MKITKQIAGILYGNGYLLQHIESGRTEKIYSVNENVFITISGLLIGFQEIGTVYKILARPNDLTKAIVVEGKEIEPHYSLGIFYPQEVDYDKLSYSRTLWLQAHNFAVNLNPEWLIYNETIYNT